MRTWVRGALAALLLISLGAALSPADAVGTGNPVIVSPTSTSALYAGYDGPVTLNFDDAPKGDYAWTVTRTSSPPPAVIDQGTYPNDGVGVPEPVRTVALVAGSYTFTIADVATGTHTDTVDFVVRAGPSPRCAAVVAPRVRVNAPSEKVPVRLSTTCSALHVIYASWKISSSRGFVGSVVFDHATTDTWTVFDGDPMGRYVFEPKSAQTLDNTSVPQNRPTPLVRRDSRLSLGGSRSGSTVTVRAALSAYSAAANGYRPWARTHVVLVYRTCSTCAWHLLRTLTTNTHGQASYTFTSAAAREYRVTSAGTSQVWAALPKYKRI